MDHKKSIKRLMELNTAVFAATFNTATLAHNNSEKNFFRFVDKNPLFPDNSKDAIYEYILASRKKRLAFESHFDEGREMVIDYLISNRLHHRDK